MLVLSRETLESIVMTVPPSDRERTIKITVLEIKRGGRTRLGFLTEPEVVVDREEVWKRKALEQAGTNATEGATDGQADKKD